MWHAETHFGTAENWKIFDEFEELVAGVEAWLGHELTEQEEKDLKSLYLYHVEGY